MFNFSPSALLTARHLKFAPVWITLGFLLIGFVCFMSVVSIPPPVKQFLLNDKLMHIGVYGCLMGWFSQIFRHDLTRLGLGIAFVAFGVGMEYVQSTVPARQFEFLDMIANTCGVLLAWALSYTWMGSILQWFEKTFLGWIRVSRPAPHPVV